MIAPRAFARAATAALCGGALLAGACGKRGDPLPPLARAPQPVKDLLVAQRGGDVEIAFSAPRVSTGGVRLGVVEMELLRATRAGEFADVALVDVRKAAPGETLVVKEPIPAPGTTLRVAVRARDGRSVSALSSVATLLVLAPPAAPAALTARVIPSGVALQWTGTIPTPPPTPPPSPTPTPSPAPSPAAAAPPPPPSPSPGPSATSSPAASPAPARAKGAGFAVYRRAADGEYATPLYAALETPSALDPGVAPGQKWCYVVRARASDTPVVESAPSNEVCVDVADVAAPEPPTGVAAVPRPPSVEVSWSPSSEADLAAYRVYRAGPDGPPIRLAELPPETTRFTDITPGRGAPHQYTVTAVDRAGNESAPSRAAEAHLP